MPPLWAKVQAINQYLEPVMKKELMRYLGMVGYYRGFCRNFLTVIAPLTDLLKANVRYLWCPDCQKAFETEGDPL